MISKDVNVSKRLKDESEPRIATFQHDFPESTAEAVEKYGESLAHRLICDSITLMLQAPARKVLETAQSGLSKEEYSSFVSSQMKDYKIEIKRNRGSGALGKVNTYQKIAQDLMNPEKRDEIIERFKKLGINLDLNGVSNDPIPLEADDVEDAGEVTPTARRRR